MQIQIQIQIQKLNPGIQAAPGELITAELEGIVARALPIVKLSGRNLVICPVLL